MGTAAFTDAEILEVVLQAMQATNLARDPASQLRRVRDAPVFGPDSPLDSLGLVALLLDIEEDLQAIGCHVRAQRRARDVAEAQPVPQRGSRSSSTSAALARE